MKSLPRVGVGDEASGGVGGRYCGLELIIGSDRSSAGDTGGDGILEADVASRPRGLSDRDKGAS